MGHPGIQPQFQARLTGMAEGLLAEECKTGERCRLEEERRCNQERSPWNAETGRGSEDGPLCKDPSWHRTEHPARSAADGRSQCLPRRTDPSRAAASRSLERMTDEYFLVFANSDYTLDLSRFLRTESTDGWHFFQGRENIGTLLIVKSGEMHYVH